MNEKIARYIEIERRGLLNQLPIEKQQAWAEIKRRGLENFADMQTPKPQEQQSVKDYAIGLGHNLGQGATLGLGPVLGGAVNQYVSPFAKTVAHFTEGTPLKLNDFNPLQNFKEGYNQYVDERDDFRQKNPKTAFGAEFVGGFIPFGLGVAGKAAQAGKAGLGALMKTGAREGAKFGGLYGFNSGLTAERNKLDVGNGLIGGATGAAGGAGIGATLPVAISGAFKGGSTLTNVARNMVKKGNAKVGNAGYVSTNATPENKVFLDLLEANPEGTMQAVKEGEPLISYANRKQLRRTRGAVVADDAADQSFQNYKEAFDSDKIQKGEDISGRLLGNESGYTATERIANDARGKYKPLYEEVMKTGELELPKEIVGNETILGAIQEAQKRAGYTRIKGNDVRVLDKAKRILQDKFVSLRKAGKLDEAREYQLAKEELVNFMDSKLPRYSQARQAFMEGQELQEYVDLGRKLKNMPHAEVARISNKLTPEQKQAVKAGLGDSVRESLYNTRKPGEDVLAKAFPEPLRRKMRALGIDDAELAKEINKEIQTNKNYQFINAGSNTANKLADVERVGLLGNLVRGAKILTSPFKAARAGADYLDFKLQGLNGEEITRLMFDPKALAREAMRPEHQRKIGEILRKSNSANGTKGNTPGIAKIIGDKLKDEGGFAANLFGGKGLPKDKYLKTPNVYDNFVSVQKNSGKVEKAPEDWTGKTIEDAKKTFGFNGKGKADIKTPVETVHVEESNLEHLFNDNEPQRKLSINKALSTMKNPNIVVNADRKGKNYNYYVKLFEKDNKTKNHMQIVKVTEDGSFYTTNYPSNKKRIADMIKEGRVVYDASNSRNMRVKENSGAIYSPSGTTPISATNSIGQKGQNVKGKSVSKILKQKERK